jgi:hypothetical protein
MPLGENFVAAGLVQPEDVMRARDRQIRAGGSLAENLVALGAITEGQLDGFLDKDPPPVQSLADTGLDANFIMTLMLKAMYVYGLASAGELAGEIKLPAALLRSLMETTRERGLIESLGTPGLNPGAEIRYALSAKGKAWITDALAQSQYVGPAPVPLVTYQAQTGKQRITNDRVDSSELGEALKSMVLGEELIRSLGPAVNSGRSMLLYGPPGNGKTSIAVALSKCFSQNIYVPYCVEVDGQIIKIYDPTIHEAVAGAGGPDKADGARSAVLRQIDTDQRWVLCKRPIAITGGELTLEMLDLRFNPVTRFYEAPIQVKTNGGVFVIDDFGRQIVTPEQMLNRWIIPLERGLDYLTLNTGKKFPLIFDGLVMFSTNFPPGQLMDAAGLRRIPYKFMIDAPSPDEFSRIFADICAAYGFDYDPDIVAFLMETYFDTGRLVLARFQPRFIIDHVIASCRYEGSPIRLDRELVTEAAEHLYTKE